MRSWFDDEVDFAGFGAALAIAACVLGIAGSSGWAWPWLIAATVVVVARVWWRSMPSPLLVLAPTVPVMVTEAQGTADLGWFIVCVAFVVAMATDRASLRTRISVAAALTGPFWLWAARIEDYVELGFWAWTMGLLLSLSFGVLLGRQRELIAELELTQRRLADAAAADERRRIAREMHDLVGHSFSVVLLHLAGARHLLHSDRPRAERALAEAEDVGRRSMDDLRAALALLRSADEPDDPVVGIESLPALAERYRSAGLDVGYVVEGDPSMLTTPFGVVLAGVAREALTNAAKHGSGGRVDIRLTIRSDRPVAMTVANAVADGAATMAGDRDGQGVRGMRERVQAIGGTLDVTTRDGTWLVRAELPARGAAIGAR